MADLFLTHGYFLDEDPKEQKIMRPYPPLGLLYVSAHLKQNGQNVHLFDSTFSSFNELKKALLEQNPKVLALYTNLMTKLNVLKIMAWVSEHLPNCKRVVGGPDVSYNIENYLKHGAQFVVVGEGESTMLELAEHLISGKGALTDIDGIAYLENNKTISNKPRTKLKDLAELPLPDRASIDFERYLDVWKTHHGKRTANISTQRGCPYTCKWCSTAVYGQSYRRRPATQVADEVEMLQQEFGVEALWFVDDVFTVSHKWLAELHSEFKNRNLRIDFECITRAERMNETVLQQLKEMGCFRIWIGAESGSQRIINKMDRRVDINLVAEMMQKTQEFGIEAGTFIMVGYPSEELSDIKQTAAYLRKAKPNLLTITKTYPIKGTSLYHEIEDHITVQPPWESSTDRDIKFKLPQKDGFYQLAIRYIMNEYHAAKSTSPLKKIKHQLKAKVAFLGMRSQ
ncbi:MAG: B12-binding domain-containing radical SAM protein [Bacteroidetes bacterium]|nr:B12-binding domain-containing radical SAM protein [Bacteroidota bacterium]